MKSYVMITGAAGGLGKAFAAECASRGWDLFLTDLPDAPLEQVAAGMERMYGVRLKSLACDLSDPAGRRTFWEQIARQGLRFHMLINVAGLDFEGPFEQRSPDELSLIVRLNVEATLEMTRCVLPLRDPTRTLRIINVSSLAGFYPMPVKAVYAASKRFLLDLSLALNEELRSQDISVTAVCPAGLPTTPGARSGIQAQGILGQITTLNVGEVAWRSIEMALAGRSVVVPGAVNQGLRWLGSLVPPRWLAGLIGRRWREARLSSQISSAQPPGLQSNELPEAAL